MGERALLPTLAAAVSAMASWTLVSHLIGDRIDWLLAIIFAVSFTSVFNIDFSRWLHHRSR